MSSLAGVEKNGNENGNALLSASSYYNDSDLRLTMRLGDLRDLKGRLSGVCKQGYSSCRNFSLIAVLLIRHHTAYRPTPTLLLTQLLCVIRLMSLSPLQFYPTVDITFFPAINQQLSFVLSISVTHCQTVYSADNCRVILACCSVTLLEYYLYHNTKS